ncbi:MAG: 50S ribosomal protein L44e [Candidatus Bathyarchaeia archaeon]
MKMAKMIRTYCPKCNSHTEHTVSVYKKGRERALAIGVRRHEREKHGYGGQKWPELKRTAKTTKKQLVKLKCKACGYVVTRLGIRLKKLTIEA